MLHACLYTICFVFCYTSWRFYAFSRTNLLTRCHSASSLFSAIFVFQKSYTRNLLGIGPKKAEPPIFPDMRWSAKMRRREARGWPHPRVAQAKPWPQHQGVSPLVHFLMPPLRLYILLDEKNPRGQSLFQKHIASHRHRRPEIGMV
jgi:hypothetical protein